MATALSAALMARSTTADAHARASSPTPSRAARELSHASSASHGSRCRSPASCAAHGDVDRARGQAAADARRRAAAPPTRQAAVVLSIAAGIRGADLARWLGGSAPRALHAEHAGADRPGHHRRCMRCRRSAPRRARAGRRASCEAVGQVVWVDDEALLDPVTAVSGSGPAYVFYFIEAMEQRRGTRLRGRSRRGGWRWAPSPAPRSSRALDRSPGHVLRERVTSKGGTTGARWLSFDRAQVRSRVVEAVAPAWREPRSGRVVRRRRAQTLQASGARRPRRDAGARSRVGSRRPVPTKIARAEPVVVAESAAKQPSACARADQSAPTKAQPGVKRPRRVDPLPSPAARRREKSAVAQHRRRRGPPAKGDGRSADADA